MSRKSVFLYLCCFFLFMQSERKTRSFAPITEKTLSRFTRLEAARPKMREAHSAVQTRYQRLSLGAHKQNSKGQFFVRWIFLSFSKLSNQDLFFERNLKFLRNLSTLRKLIDGDCRPRNDRTECELRQFSKKLVPDTFNSSEVI